MVGEEKDRQREQKLQGLEARMSLPSMKRSKTVWLWHVEQGVEWQSMMQGFAVLSEESDFYSEGNEKPLVGNKHENDIIWIDFSLRDQNTYLYCPHCWDCQLSLVTRAQDHERWTFPTFTWVVGRHLQQYSVHESAVYWTDLSLSTHSAVS